MPVRRLAFFISLLLGANALAGDGRPAGSYVSPYQVENSYTCRPRASAKASRPWLHDQPRIMTMHSTKSCADAEEALQRFLDNDEGCDDLHSYEVLERRFLATPVCPISTNRR